MDRALHACGHGPAAAQPASAAPALAPPPRQLARPPVPPLVPGLTLEPDGSATSPGAVSLRFDHPFGKLTLLRCITGPLVVAPDVEVEMKDCIVDAGAPGNVAFDGDGAGGAGGALTVREST